MTRQTTRVTGTFAVLSVSILLAACSGGGNAPAPSSTPTPGNNGSVTPTANPSYTYQIPDDLGDGWTVGHLSDESFDVEAVVNVMQGIQNGSYPGIDAVALSRHGKLLLNETFRTRLDEFDTWINNTALDRHCMHSTSKSFVSAVVGISVDQGYIVDVSQPYYDIFTYASYDNWDPRKATMTLEDVLTMRLGLEWDEGTYAYTDSRNSLSKLNNQNWDWTKALLDLPMVASPGTTFVYNTAASTSLARALEFATAAQMERYAETVLFEPLQITQAEWDLTPSKFPVGGSGLFLGTRDMAKFGQLYLNRGEWNGQQIISGEWVDASLVKRVSLNGSYVSGYGYQWWLGELQAGSKRYSYFSTQGYGGQFIIVIPELDLIAAFTGRNYTNDLFYSPFDLLERFIIPSISS